MGFEFLKLRNSGLQSMGAHTSNRKRSEECLNLNRTNSNHNSPDFQVLKKPRLWAMGQSVEPSISSASSVISRISLYPDSKSPLPRAVHAPCRTLKFGVLSSFNRVSRAQASRFFDKRESGQDMGNFMSYKYSRYKKAKDSALASIRYLDKGKEVIEVDGDDNEKDVVSEDSIMEDGKEGRSGVTEQRSLDTDVIILEVPGSGAKVPVGVAQLQSTSSVVSQFTDGDMKGENAKKIVNFLCISERDVSSVSAYKKLLERVRSRTSTIEHLEFEIKLNEGRRSLLSLSPAKKRVEVVPEEIFLPLTKEEVDVVSCALSVNKKKVLVVHDNSNIEITGEVLHCLRPGQWLNDEVINLYLELLKEREARDPKKFLKCHFFNTFFYKKLASGRGGYDFKAVKRWTTLRKLGYGLIECDKIFVPIHQQVHWCLAVINKKDEKFQYLDSLQGKDTKVLNLLSQYYIDEVKDKSGKDVDVSTWEQEFVEDLPEQENGYDCGVFMIKYADFHSRGLGLCFDQGHMPYFRRRTAKEILRLRAD